MFEKYKATKTDEPAGWIEQEELCWQALYFSGSSYNRDGYERSSYYETEQEAIEAAKEAERIGNRGIYGIGLVGEFKIRPREPQNEKFAFEHGLDEQSIELHASS